VYDKWLPQRHFEQYLSHLQNKDHNHIDRQNFLDQLNIFSLLSFRRDCGKWLSWAQIAQKDLVDEQKVDAHGLPDAYFS
jgi:hypothetical protein